MACSEMGVERTRLVPYLLERPLLTLNTPPPCSSATSSPRIMTFPSSAIASSSAALRAWPKLIVFPLMLPAPFRDVEPDLVRIRRITFQCERHGIFDFGVHLLFDLQIGRASVRERVCQYV